MNKETKITVKTPLGNTEEEDTGAHLRQGTIEGAVLSANNIDKGVNEYLGDENDMNYGNLVIKSLIFQGDIASLSKTIETAQSKNNKMEAMLETKLLDLNILKSVVLVNGTKKFRSDTLEQLKCSPLTLSNKLMKLVDEYTYLGEVLHSGGLGASISVTISKRIGIF